MYWANDAIFPNPAAKFFTPSVREAWSPLGVSFRSTSCRHVCWVCNLCISLPRYGGLVHSCHLFCLFLIPSPALQFCINEESTTFRFGAKPRVMKLMFVTYLNSWLKHAETLFAGSQESRTALTKVVEIYVFASVTTDCRGISSQTHSCSQPIKHINIVLSTKCHFFLFWIVSNCRTPSWSGGLACFMASCQMRWMGSDW